MIQGHFERLKNFFTEHERPLSRCFPRIREKTLSLFFSHMAHGESVGNKFTGVIYLAKLPKLGIFNRNKLIHF